MAFADVERGRLYMNVDGTLDSRTIRRTIHHEFFHQVDFADDQSLASDPRWEALNPPAFHYTLDAERLKADPTAALLDEGLLGFLNRYSATNPAEDKAELYSYLVTERAMVLRRAARDDVLRRKVDRLRAMLDDLGSFGGSLVGQ
jgi:hypothetical protein